MQSSLFENLRGLSKQKTLLTHIQPTMKSFLYLILCLPVVFSQISEEIDSQFYDVFFTENREWRLVFRGTPAINQSVWHAFTTHQTIKVEPGCKQIFSQEPCQHHYRNNDVMDHWANFEQVAFVIYKGGVRVAHVIFDGTGTNYQNWCDSKRIVSSSWTDIKKNGKNFFSVHGDDSLQRRFFMNHQYGGCPSDAGWFVAVDRKNVPCAWEKNSGFPMFLYAKKDVMTNWTTGDVERADFIAVFVKYNTGAVVGK
ncbi:uncharacterized protein LOC101863664 [Aplysia californica]|uniref:Uncharacterized protein LOC101863664 n=1 Tax=Aplysia californica TaxID=6500 RepID=A0ABM0JL20_APLCA|nr:uncharacterized protein LOC101863664 [Aplysia californica]